MQRRLLVVVVVVITGVRTLRIQNLGALRRSNVIRTTYNAIECESSQNKARLTGRDKRW